MALNKDLNYVAMNDNGAGKNYTNEEIEANKARAKAAGYGTATTVNSAYNAGQTFGNDMQVLLLYLVYLIIQDIKRK